MQVLRRTVSIAAAVLMALAVTAEAGSAQALEPDRAFLRAMVDHYEIIRTMAHERMMMPASHGEHGKKADPAELDSQFDMQQREALALLNSLYRDRYSARPIRTGKTAPAARSGSMAGMSMPESSSMAGSPAQVVAMLRDGVKMLDRYRGRLRHAEVKAIAARHRATMAAMITSMAPEPTSNDSIGH